MSPGRFRFMKQAGLFACLATSLTAADFAPPAEGPVAFRRDRLPLDVETIGSLSGQLVILARGLDATTPAKRRAAAQMLALSMVLDPGNTKARELVAQYVSGDRKPKGDAEDLEKARTTLWQLVSWLESPDAGTEGHSLAACLKDTLISSNPEDPKTAALQGRGELGSWTGWIPTLSSYQDAPAKPEDHEEETKGKAPGMASSGSIKLTNAEVSTLMWTSAKGLDGKDKWTLAPGVLQMSARMAPPEGGQPAPFSVRFGTRDDGGFLITLEQAIPGYLKDLNPPAGGQVDLGGGDFTASLASRKMQAISAAATLLAAAAVTGREPTGAVLGTFDVTGAFTLSTGFWEQLRAMENAPPGRLVLPAEAAEYLPAMLAMEKPQFFLRHEVLLAKNLRELLEFSAKSPAEPLAGITARFKEIRDKTDVQAVGNYLANPHVRRRLAEIAQEMPLHYSARMLAIQGSGSRPTKIPRPVLVPEIRRALAPMAWMGQWQGMDSSGEVDNANIPRVGPTYEACRTQVDALKRYVTKEDQPLMAEVDELLTAIRTVERVVRSRAASYEVYAAQTKLIAAYKTTMNDLARAVGEPVVKPESRSAGDLPPD